MNGFVDWAPTTAIGVVRTWGKTVHTSHLKLFQVLVVWVGSNLKYLSKVLQDPTLIAVILIFECWATHLHFVGAIAPAILLCL